METLQINGNKVVINDGNTSLILEVDPVNNLIQLKSGTTPDEVRLEIDVAAKSISILNSSDLGVTCDNAGTTTIHILKVDGDAQVQALVLPSPSGTLFRCAVDDNGNWINVAVP